MFEAARLARANSAVASGTSFKTCIETLGLLICLLHVLQRFRYVSVAQLHRVEAIGLSTEQPYDIVIGVFLLRLIEK